MADDKNDKNQLFKKRNCKLKAKNRYENLRNLA